MSALQQLWRMPALLVACERETGNRKALNGASGITTQTFGRMFGIHANRVRDRLSVVVAVAAN